MIDRVDQRLRDWILAVVGEVEIALSAPLPDPPHEGVGLYLLEVQHRPPPRGPGPPPLQLLLRYLITTWGPDVLQAHRRLGDLIMAALEHGEFEVEADPVPPATWQALGLAPRPAFVLRAPVRRERPPLRVQSVREVVLEHEALASLEGRVMGPGDAAIPNARVEVPSLSLVTWTDDDGRFRFAGVPAGDRVRSLRVSAKGVRTLVEREGTGFREPLIIRLPISEG